MNNIPERGDHVREVQSALRIKRAGGADLPQIIPDGIYGEETRECVAAFQRAEELDDTGIVDYTTWQRLFEVKY